MLCHWEKTLGSKKKNSLFSLLSRKITFELVYIATTVKVLGFFFLNHIKYKTLLLFPHPPQKDTISLLCLPLCKYQPGLNAGPIGIGHIAPFLPFLSNHDATESRGKA